MTMSPNEMAEACFAFEEKDKAVACLKRVVSEFQDQEGVCRPKLVLLVQEDCEVCAREKEKHAPAINSGIVEVVDAATPEGMSIVSKNGIGYAPALLFLDCHDNSIFAV